MKIDFIFAYEILDSRGVPTVKAVISAMGREFCGLTPSGTSTGKNEAKELRDNDKKRYNGQGVLKAINNIQQKIAPFLINKDFQSQEDFDNVLISLDSTANKSNLGANAILPLSMAFCRALSAVEGKKLFQKIAEISDKKESYKMPLACFNVFNGGAHGNANISIQEFMIIPDVGSFAENLRTASEIYFQLKKILALKDKKFFGQTGLEGGFVADIKKIEDVLQCLLEAVKKCKIKSKVSFGLDAAASGFYKNKKYFYQGKDCSFQELQNHYNKLINNYPIVFLEDPFAENDFPAWQIFNNHLQEKSSDVFLLGDDLTVTNKERILLSRNKNLCNGLIVKPNQIGTVSQAIAALNFAQSFGWKIVVSHRSGDVCDDFLADLSVGCRADFVKFGAPSRGERVAKYNRLIEIEKAIS